MIDRVQFSTGAASGSAGSASATGYSPHVSGKVLSVCIEYVDSPPGTADVTISDEGDPSAEAFYTLSNWASTWRDYPRRGVQSPTAGTITYDGTRPVYDHIVVHGRLKGTIAQVNAGDSATITVWLEI